MDPFCSESESIAALIEEIAYALRAHPQGMSEYELILILRNRGFFGYLEPPPADPYALFRAHFLTFHALYRLQDALWKSKSAYLEIDTLKIHCLPYRQGQSSLGTPDIMRDYYLDLSQLATTSARNIHVLIASFWTHLQNNEKRAEALKELGLVDPVDDDTIRKTYRRMAMKHHPDRGGSKTRLQALNRAVELLSRNSCIRDDK